MSVTPCTYTKYSSVRVLTRHVSFMRICNCHIFRILPHFSHISGKCVHRIFFPHKLVFSMAILILIVFLLPISIRFRYLDHLVAHKMAPSRCLDPCGMSWGSCFKQFCTIFLPHIWCLCSPHTFFKCRIKLSCLTI